jgi:hypothetical protein
VKMHLQELARYEIEHGAIGAFERHVPHARCKHAAFGQAQLKMFCHDETVDASERVAILAALPHLRSP